MAPKVNYGDIPRKANRTVKNGAPNANTRQYPAIVRNIPNADPLTDDVFVCEAIEHALHLIDPENPVNKPFLIVAMTTIDGGDRKVWMTKEEHLDKLVQHGPRIAFHNNDKNLRILSPADAQCLIVVPTKLRIPETLSVYGDLVLAACFAIARFVGTQVSEVRRDGDGSVVVAFMTTHDASVARGRVFIVKLNDGLWAHFSDYVYRNPVGHEKENRINAVVVDSCQSLDVEKKEFAVITRQLPLTGIQRQRGQELGIVGRAEENNVRDTFHGAAGEAPSGVAKADTSDPPAGHFDPEPFPLGQ